MTIFMTDMHNTLKEIREQVKTLREQVIDKVIDILVKNGKEIDLTGRTHTPFVDTKVGELCFVNRIVYHCPEGYEHIKGADNITLDLLNEEYNCTLTLEELEWEYLIDIAIYLEENFS